MSNNLPAPVPTPGELERLPSGSSGKWLWVVLGKILVEVLKDKDVQAWLKKNGIKLAKALASKTKSSVGKAFRRISLEVAKRKARKQLPPPSPGDETPTSPLLDTIKRAMDSMKDEKEEAAPPMTEEKGSGLAGFLAGMAGGLALAFVVKKV